MSRSACPASASANARAFSSSSCSFSANLSLSVSAPSGPVSRSLMRCCSALFSLTTSSRAAETCLVTSCRTRSNSLILSVSAVSSRKFCSSTHTWRRLSSSSFKLTSSSARSARCSKSFGSSIASASCARCCAFASSSSARANCRSRSSERSRSSLSSRLVPSTFSSAVVTLERISLQTVSPNCCSSPSSSATFLCKSALCWVKVWISLACASLATSARATRSSNCLRVSSNCLRMSSA
mmetsp:Transcript_116447/g.232183  ORF Transcript_116447/g.232183 Transcript_116447/m.232183 type:complete len:239 (-) Transcript_116447:1218-1934(-)